MSDIPARLWDLIDADHAFRDALAPGGLARYQQVAAELLAAAWEDDTDRLDDAINKLSKGELQILVVCLAFTTVEYIRQIARVMSADDARMLHDLLGGDPDGEAD